LLASIYQLQPLPCYPHCVTHNFASPLAVLQAGAAANATKAANTTTTAAAAKSANATTVAAKSADLPPAEPAASPAPAATTEPKKNSAVSAAAATCVSFVMAAGALVLAMH
jgi:predicted component of type VI protein secretion system